MATTATRSANINLRARRVGSPGDGIRTADLETLFAAALGLCQYCGQRSELVTDHIEPLSRGGANEIGNLAVACGACNQSKYDRPLLIWFAIQAIERSLGPDEQRCADCGHVLPRTAFSAATSVCRRCDSARDKLYRQRLRIEGP